MAPEISQLEVGPRLLKTTAEEGRLLLCGMEVGDSDLKKGPHWGLIGQAESVGRVFLADEQLLQSQCVGPTHTLPRCGSSTGGSF